MRFGQSQISTNPVENVVEAKSLTRIGESCRPFGRLNNRDRRPLTLTNIGRYQFVKMCSVGR